MSLGLALVKTQYTCWRWMMMTFKTDHGNLRNPKEDIHMKSWFRFEPLATKVKVVVKGKALNIKMFLEGMIFLNNVSIE
jgi:hypothetical protein